MGPFSVGDQVVIRFGKQQGRKGTIIKNQLDSYRVKLENGSILFFCEKGLERAKQQVRHFK